MYDHSIRPPMIVIGPDIPKNQQSNADVYLQDVMASALALAGANKQEFIEFNSLINLAKSPSDQGNYNAIYGCYTDAQRMIRKDGFKLIAYPKAGATLLFDLENDPLELKDLNKDVKYEELKKSLFSDLLTLQKTMGDTTDLRSAFPDLIP